MESDCILCDTRRQQTTFVSLVARGEADLTSDNPILFETEHFYLTIDLHPVSDCHYLIIPKGHYTSYSLVPVEYERELDFIVGLIKEKTNTENFILFEHGSGIVNERLVGCGNSIFHAHLHFIGGLKYDLTEILGVISSYGVNPKELFMKRIKPGESLLQNISVATYDGSCYHSPYLFLKFNDTDCFVMPEREETRIQSQFFRKMFAEEISGKGCFWNWKEGISHTDRLVLRQRVIRMIDLFKTKTQEV